LFNFFYSPKDQADKTKKACRQTSRQAKIDHPEKFENSLSRFRGISCGYGLFLGRLSWLDNFDLIKGFERSGGFTAAGEWQNEQQCCQQRS